MLFNLVFIFSPTSGAGSGKFRYHLRIYVIPRMRQSGKTSLRWFELVCMCVGRGEGDKVLPIRFARSASCPGTLLLVSFLSATAPPDKLNFMAFPFRRTRYETLHRRQPHTCSGGRGAQREIAMIRCPGRRIIPRTAKSNETNGAGG